MIFGLRLNAVTQLKTHSLIQLTFFKNEVRGRPPEPLQPLRVNEGKLGGNTMATATAERTGTTVYDAQGNNVGSIKRIMIDKLSEKVAYVVMSFGGFLGMGAEDHSIPWNKLTYDANLGGFRTDITEQCASFFAGSELGLE